MKNFGTAIKVIALILCSVLIFGGCSFFDFFSVDSLMRAPKLTGENALIQQAFETAVGSNAALLSPVAGDYRSAYILKDIDADDVDEALVFYKPSVASGDVHIHLLDYNGSEWISLADIVGNGTDVYSIEFCKLDADDISELAVVWTVSDSIRSKVMSVYKLSPEDGKNYINTLGTFQISDYMFIDLNLDLQSELFYVYCDTTVYPYQSSAVVMKFDVEDNAVIPVSELNFTSEIAAFVNITSEAKDDNFLFYLDCLSPETTYFTEIICFDAEKSALIVPSFSSKSSAELTGRITQIVSQDINGDSLIEIPVEYDYPNSVYLNTTDAQSQQIKILEWMRYSDYQFKSVGKYFVNNYDGFSISIDALYEQAYIVYDYETRTTQFRLRDIDEENNLLFSIVFNSDAADSISLQSYTIRVTELGKKMDMTQTMIKELIYLN